ncbi:Uncharacterized protein APZ42_016861 [Daphnia magna]|uniref:Uncharacterized protein n=1 Tax=Daphnia magna TaxID=35525 RepID=A0A165A787_9CRUS|nr:Uncharacterized protein APZ42_016861 [Daphnia magna]
MQLRENCTCIRTVTVGHAKLLVLQQFQLSSFLNVLLFEIIILLTTLIMLVSMTLAKEPIQLTWNEMFLIDFEGREFPLEQPWDFGFLCTSF